jgi:hypothetical protein
MMALMTWSRIFSCGLMYNFSPLEKVYGPMIKANVHAELGDQRGHLLVKLFVMHHASMAINE